MKTWIQNSFIYTGYTLDLHKIQFPKSFVNTLVIARKPRAEVYTKISKTYVKSNSTFRQANTNKKEQKIFVALKPSTDS